MRTMKKLVAILLAAVLLLPALAWADADQKVVDLAGLLSDQEEADLAAQSQRFMEDYNLDLVFCTTADAQGKTAQAFADDYYDYNGYGAADGKHSGLLLLIDMDNREVTVSTLGAAVERIDDREVELILDAMYQGVTKEQYGQALSGGAKAAAKAVGSGGQGTAAGVQGTAPAVPGNVPATKSSFRVSGGLLVGALAGGLAAGGLAAWGVSHSYSARNAPDNYPLEQNARLNLTQQQDILVGRHVDKIKIERNTGSGGSTHTSSSGRSHGGGSRGF